MTRRPVAACATVLLVLGLASCGSDDGSSDPESSASATPSAEAATGDVVEEEAFSYTMPEGWAELDEPRAVTAAADENDDDGFRDNLNAVEDAMVAQMSGDELTDSVVQSLESAGVKEVTVRDAVTIDGEEAIHVASVFSINDNDYRTEQYAVAHDGAGYVITFSHSMETTQAERDEVDRSVLATWTWA